MKYHRVIGAALMLIALCAVAVQAQSGRRQTKPPPTAPVPTPTPEPTPTPKKEDKEPGLHFSLGADRNSSTYASFPMYFYDAILRGCSDRLRGAATVDVSDNDLSRGDAIKKAKAETGSYVILLSLTLDAMSRSYDDLDVNYVVFAPGTAKVVTSGRSYLNGQRSGPVVVGPRRGSTSALYREQMLRQAGEDAAERILKAVHRNVPVGR